MNPSSSHLQDVFPVEGIDLQVCPRQCLRNDWEQWGCAQQSAELLSTIWCFLRRNLEPAVLPLEALQSWGAQAGVGCRMATAQGSQHLLIDQEMMGNTGRVQGNQPTYFCSLQDKAQINQVLFVPLIFWRCFVWFGFSKGKNGAKLQIPGLSCWGKSRDPFPSNKCPPGSSAKTISHSHPNKMRMRRRLPLIHPPGPGLQTANDGPWEVSKLLLGISLLKMFSSEKVPAPLSVQLLCKAGIS